jgi:hypothetical protein
MVSIFLAKQPTLQRLVRRMIFYFLLALLGSWGLLVPRLLTFQLNYFPQGSVVWLYLDVGSLALVIFSVFMIFYNNSILKPRLQRLVDLREDQW